MLTFYDWYADLPSASPQVFGDQTDVPESADWWNASLPDHLGHQPPDHPHARRPLHGRGALPRPEGRRRLARLLRQHQVRRRLAGGRTRAPTAALAMAMGHVILKEFYRRPAGAPLRRLRPHVHRPAVPGHPARARRRASSPDQFLTAADLGERRPRTRPSGRPSCSTRPPGTPAVPNGSLGFRWTDSGMGRWNLDLEGDPTRRSRCTAAPGPSRGGGPAPLRRRRHDGEGGGASCAGASRRCRVGEPPGDHRLRPGAGAVRRGPRRTCRASGRRATTTPARPTRRPGRSRSPRCPPWPPPGSAREFARNAEVSGGRSMIAMGAGTNHWFHSDTIYRSFLLCSCCAAARGSTAAAGRTTSARRRSARSPAGRRSPSQLDWVRPTRHMAGTPFWYLATDQWRYEG